MLEKNKDISKLNEFIKILPEIYNLPETKVRSKTTLEKIIKIINSTDNSTSVTNKPLNAKIKENIINYFKGTQKGEYTIIDLKKNF